MPEERNTNVDLEFYNKIETAVAGVLVFLWRFINLSLDLILLRKIDLSDTEKKTDKKIMQPYTFIAINTFIAIKSIRFATLLLTIALLSFFSIFKSCRSGSIVTLVEPAEPSFIDYIGLPSISELILIGVPIIALTIIMAKAFAYICFGKNSTHMQKPINAACYAIGIQQIFITVAVLPFILHNKFSGIYFSYILDATIGLLLIVVIIFWPIVILSRQFLFVFDSTKPRWDQPLVKQLIAITVSIIFCSTLFISSFGVSLLFYWEDIEKDAYNFIRPLLTVDIIAQDSSDKALCINLLIANNGDNRIHILREPVEYIDKENKQFKGTIATRDLSNPISQIQSGDVNWMKINLMPTGKIIDRGIKRKTRIIKFEAFIEKKNIEGIYLSRKTITAKCRPLVSK